jgi:hypothetical protein
MMWATFQPSIWSFFTRSSTRVDVTNEVQIFSKLGQSPFVGFRRRLGSSHRKKKFWQRLGLALLIFGVVLVGFGKSHAQGVLTITRVFNHQWFNWF